MNLNIKLNKYRPISRDCDRDRGIDDDTLAPVMPAIDVVQQLIEEESRRKVSKNRFNASNSVEHQPGTSDQNSTQDSDETNVQMNQKDVQKDPAPIKIKTPNSQHLADRTQKRTELINNKIQMPLKSKMEIKDTTITEAEEVDEEEQSFLVRNNLLLDLINNCEPLESKQDEYEFVPKSVILDVYSNDPEVKRFLKQMPKIFNEFGYNEQDYKCYSCRRPVGLVFGQSRLCHFDGHHYCSECHLGEKSVIPSRILCNWDFNKYPISKRNQHFLTLISNEPMFELKKVSPKLYRVCPELREIEELRRQAFFVRSYCITCVQDCISFELTKLIWPREHLIKQTDLYSLEDFIQLKSGSLKQVLKGVISFGKQHVLSCVLCCQKGFICEICKSSHIIYPFDTESVYRCNECQSIYHKTCFKSRFGDDACPRCQRLKARRHSEL